MSDTSAKGGRPGIFFIDMHGIKITADSSKEIYVSLGYRFGERRLLSNFQLFIRFAAFEFHYDLLCGPAVSKIGSVEAVSKRVQV